MTTAATIKSERWLDQVVLQAGLPADVAGAALSESISLPAGIGDVAVMSIHFRALSVDVGPASAYTVAPGVRAMVISADASTLVDTIGVGAWLLTFNTANNLEYSAMIDPDALVLWRQGELLNVASPELDSDATPTGDVNVFIKCVRVRDVVGQEVKRPIRLVR